MAQGTSRGRAAGFLLGTILLAVGVGLGPSHAGREGLTVATVVGLASLVVGLVLMVLTAWRLLASTRRRWWLLLVPLMLVTTYLALWTVGQAVFASFVARPDLGKDTPADRGLDYQDVTFDAADGVELAGWYVPSENGAAVVLLHGASGTRSKVLDQAVVLAENGYGVLLVDARGHGESDGRAMEFGWYGERDVEGAVDFLADQADVVDGRIGVVGLSMGGEEAIGAAGRDPRIRAVVAEGATNRVSEDKAFLAEYGVRGQVQRGIDWLTYGVTELLTPAPRPGSLRDSVADIAPRPVLLVTAGEVETERLAAEHMRKAAPSSVELWEVDGAGHTQGLDTSPEEWEQRVVGFLDAALEPTG